MAVISCRAWNHCHFCISELSVEMNINFKLLHRDSLKTLFPMPFLAEKELIGIGTRENLLNRCRLVSKMMKNSIGNDKIH